MNPRDQLRDRLSQTVKTVLDQLEHDGVELPRDLRAWKTVTYYELVLIGNVRNLFGGEMTESAFIDDLVRLIDEQFTRAFNEGMRDNDLDPEKDMRPEWEDALQERKLQEFDYVDNYAAEIIKAAQEGGEIGSYLDRASMWAHRYDEIVSWARMLTRPEDRYKWVVGPTEHCEDCARLNGIVATGADWIASDWRPQGDMLACHGFRCQCTLEYTEEKTTPGGIPGAAKSVKYSPDQPRDEIGRWTDAGGGDSGEGEGEEGGGANISSSGKDILDKYNNGGLYYRSTPTEDPMSNWGHAMMANDDRVAGQFGENLWTFDPSAGTRSTVHIDDLQPKISEALQNAVDDGYYISDAGADIDYFVSAIGAGELSIDNVVSQFNPVDIVDSAGAYDSDLSVWLYEAVLEPNNIGAVITQDGAVIYDPDKMISLGKTDKAGNGL